MLRIKCNGKFTHVSFISLHINHRCQSDFRRSEINFLSRERVNLDPKKSRARTNLLRDLQLVLRVLVERFQVVAPLLQGRLLLEQREPVLRRLYLLGGGQVELARQTLDLGPQLLEPDPVDGGGHCCLRDDDDDDDEDRGGDDDDDEDAAGPPSGAAAPRVTPASSSPFSVAPYTTSGTSSLSRVKRMDAGRRGRAARARTHPSVNPADSLYIFLSDASCRYLVSPPVSDDARATLLPLLSGSSHPTFLPARAHRHRNV